MSVGSDIVLCEVMLSPEIMEEMRKGVEYAKEHKNEFPPDEIGPGVGFVLYSITCGGC